MVMWLFSIVLIACVFAIVREYRRNDMEAFWIYIIIAVMLGSAFAAVSKKFIVLIKRAKKNGRESLEYLEKNNLM